MVPDFPVAVKTVGILTLESGAHESGYFLVATDTGILDNGTIESFYLQWLGEISSSKGHTVVPAINRFDHVFPQEIRGSVAIIACRRRVMAGAGPNVVMLPHDVTILTGYGIIPQI